MRNGHNLIWCCLLLNEQDMNEWNKNDCFSLMSTNDGVKCFLTFHSASFCKASLLFYLISLRITTITITIIIQYIHWLSIYINCCNFENALRLLIIMNIIIIIVILTATTTTTVIFTDDSSIYVRSQSNFSAEEASNEWTFLQSLSCRNVLTTHLKSIANFSPIIIEPPYLSMYTFLMLLKPNGWQLSKYNLFPISNSMLCFNNSLIFSNFSKSSHQIQKRMWSIIMT